MLLREEILNLRRERDMALDRVMILADRPQAVTPAVDSSVADFPDERPQTEQEAIERDEQEAEMIAEEARKELEKYAEGRGVSPDVLADV